MIVDGQNAQLRGHGPISVDRTPGEDVLTLARRRSLTVYDAAYLELARRADLPLATLDRRLAVAARAEQVALIGEDAE